MERCYICDEIAQRYGVKLITVYDWIRKKKMPAIKVGKSYRVRPEDIKEFETARQTVQRDLGMVSQDSGKAERGF